MRFTETELAGAWLVDLEPLADDRGWFARSFCADEFAAHGLDPVVAQCNVTVTDHAGTIRGLHYQCPPAEESKLVRCTRGAVLDVAVDLRADSPTFLRHLAVELTAASHRALYLPARFAHGFQALTDDVELHYQMGAPYVPGTARGLRYDDPALGIEWPLPVRNVSGRDAAWPDVAGRERDLLR